jgi:hypothetical protein
MDWHLFLLSGQRLTRTNHNKVNKENECRNVKSRADECPASLNRHSLYKKTQLLRKAGL